MDFSLIKVFWEILMQYRKQGGDFEYLHVALQVFLDPQHFEVMQEFLFAENMLEEALLYERYTTDRVKTVRRTLVQGGLIQKVAKGYYLPTPKAYRFAVTMFTENYTKQTKAKAIFARMEDLRDQLERETGVYVELPALTEIENRIDSTENNV